MKVHLTCSEIWQYQLYRVTDGSRTIFKKKYSVDFQLEMDVFLQN